MDSPLNIKPGDALPPVTLTVQQPDGAQRELQLPVPGRACVLFWYPKADTPG